MSARDAVLLQLIAGGRKIISHRIGHWLVFGWDFMPEFEQDMTEYGKYDFDEFVKTFCGDHGMNLYKLEHLPFNFINFNHILPYVVTSFSGKFGDKINRIITDYDYRMLLLSL